MTAVLERQKVTVRPSGAALGADIEGVDLSRALAPETVDAIKAAWGDHLVLRFRGQQLDDDELMRFSRAFRRARPGAGHRRGTGQDRRRQRGHRSRRGSNTSWSSPTSSRTARRSASSAPTSRSGTPTCRISRAAHAPRALYSLEVPPSGGDTGFATCTSPMSACRRICAGRSKAACAATMRAATAPANCAAALSKRPTRAQALGAEHPIVRTHPVTGSKALFLGRRRNAYIAGLPLDDSERCSTRCGRTHQARFRLVPAMAGGDLMLWDNRCAHASPRRVRSRRPPRHAPHPDQRRPPVLTPVSEQ